MNVQKIFDALQWDTQNSALGIICGELEAQGYSVTIDGQNVSSGSFFNGRQASLERRITPLDFALFRDGVLEQEFTIEFFDFHGVAIKPKSES